LLFISDKKKAGRHYKKTNTAFPFLTKGLKLRATFFCCGFLRYFFLAAGFFAAGFFFAVAMEPSLDI